MFDAVESASSEWPLCRSPRAELATLALEYCFPRSSRHPDAICSPDETLKPQPLLFHISSREVLIWKRWLYLKVLTLCQAPALPCLSVAPGRRVTLQKRLCCFSIGARDAHKEHGANCGTRQARKLQSVAAGCCRLQDSRDVQQSLPRVALQESAG